MVILQAIEQGKPVPAEVLTEVLTETGTTGEPGLTSEPPDIATAKSATGPTEAPAQTEATGVQGEKKDIVAPEIKPGPSTVAGPPAATATTETGTTGEPGQHPKSRKRHNYRLA